MEGWFSFARHVQHQKVVNLTHAETVVELGPRIRVLRFCVFAVGCFDNAFSEGTLHKEQLLRKHSWFLES